MLEYTCNNSCLSTFHVINKLQQFNKNKSKPLLNVQHGQTLLKPIKSHCPVTDLQNAQLLINARHITMQCNVTQYAIHITRQCNVTQYVIHKKANTAVLSSSFVHCCREEGEEEANRPNKNTRHSSRVTCARLVLSNVLRRAFDGRFHLCLVLGTLDVLDGRVPRRLIPV